MQAANGKQQKVTVKEEITILPSKQDGNNRRNRYRNKSKKSIVEKEKQAAVKAVKIVKNDIRRNNANKPAPRVKNDYNNTFVKPYRNPQSNNIADPYIRALLNPETDGDGVKVPDRFFGMTSTFKTVTNIYPPILHANDVVDSNVPGSVYAFGGRDDFPAGRWAVAGTPGFYNPLSALTEYYETPAPNTFANYNVILTSNTDFTGFESIDGTEEDESNMDNTLMLTPGEMVNVVGNIIPGARTPAFEHPMYLCKAQDGTFFYGSSVNIGNSGFIRTNVTYDNYAAGAALRLTLVDITGEITNMTVPLTDSGKAQFLFVNLHTAFRSDFRGNKMIGFRLSYTAPSTNESLIINSVGINFCIQNSDQTSPLTRQVKQLEWVPYNFDSLDIADRLYHKYRIVAQSLLATNYSNPFSSGGTSVSKSVIDEPFWFANTNNDNALWTVPGLSASPYAEQGKMAKGLYSYWLPIRDQSLQLKNKKESGKFNEAHSVQTGFVDLVNAGGGVGIPYNPIRVRQCTEYEATSNSQIVPLTMSPVNDGSIRRLKALIEDKNFPRDMPNDTHEEIIKALGIPTKALVNAVGDLKKIAPELAMAAALFL